MAGLADGEHRKSLIGEEVREARIGAQAVLIGFDLVQARSSISPIA
jgi:hypothetical protein